LALAETSRARADAEMDSLLTDLGFKNWKNS
jgi:hypothetical protein